MHMNTEQVRAGRTESIVCACKLVSPQNRYGMHIRKDICSLAVEHARTHLWLARYIMSLIISDQTDSINHLRRRERRSRARHPNNQIRLFRAQPFEIYGSHYFH